MRQTPLLCSVKRRPYSAGASVMEPAARPALQHQACKIYASINASEYSIADNYLIHNNLAKTTTPGIFKGAVLLNQLSFRDLCATQIHKQSVMNMLRRTLSRFTHFTEKLKAVAETRRYTAFHVTTASFDGKVQTRDIQSRDAKAASGRLLRSISPSMAFKWKGPAADEFRRAAERDERCCGKAGAS